MRMKISDIRSFKKYQFFWCITSLNDLISALQLPLCFFIVSRVLFSNRIFHYNKMSRVGGEEHTISMIRKEAPTGRSLRPEAQTSILGLNRGFTAFVTFGKHSVPWAKCPYLHSGVQAPAFFTWSYINQIIWYWWNHFINHNFCCKWWYNLA